MKNVFKSFMLIAVAAIAFVSCEKAEQNIDTHEGDYYYSFAINNVDNPSPTSKASLSQGDNLYLQWENGDSFGAYATNTQNKNSVNRSSTVSVSSSGYTLNVATTVELLEGSTVYTYFPYNATGGTKTAAVINIATVQTQKASGYDASVMPMVGEVYNITTPIDANQSGPVGSINFANLGSLIEFNIYSTTAINEQIKSVEFISSTGNLAGNFTVDLTAVNFEDVTTLNLGEGSAASVKTVLESPVEIPVSSTTAKEGTKVYMSIAPGSYTGNVVVATTAHTYTFKVTSAKTFNRSKIKRLNANLSSVTPGDPATEETWELITDASNFTEGTYVIVSSDKTSYLVNSAAIKNPASAAAHWDADGNLTNVTDDAKWIATASGSGLIFASYDKSSNYLWQSTSVAQGVSVAESAGSDGIANQKKVWTLVANATLGGESGYIATTGNNRYLALYTNGTWRGYTITATGENPGYFNGNPSIKAAIFYKLSDSRIALATPILSVNGSEVSWSAISNAGSYLVTIGSDEYIINTTSVDLDDYSLSDGEYTVTVIAVPSNSVTYKNSAPASTTVTVGNPSGTSSNPYSVSEALVEANKLSDGETTANEVYVSGIVSTVSSYNSTYKSITYFISDDGTTANQLEIYGGLDVEGSDFADVYDLAVGDVVVVKGKLKKFGEILEMDKNSHIVSNTKVARYTISLSNVSNGTISASTSKAGAKAVISLTATPVSGYQLDSWTVMGANNQAIPVENNSFTMPASNVTVSASFINSVGEEVTLQYSGSSTTNMTGNNDAATLGLDASKWSVVGAKGGHTLYPGLNKSKYIALYYHDDGNNYITVSSLDNATINSIIITYTGNNYNNGKVFVDGDEVSETNGQYTIDSNSFEIRNGNTSNVQVRISKIEINYTPAN